MKRVIYRGCAIGLVFPAFFCIFTGSGSPRQLTYVICLMILALIFTILYVSEEHKQ